MSYAIKRIPPMAVIDVDDDADLAKWAAWLGVSEGELLDAIMAVGPFAAAVRDYLAQEE